MAAQPGVRRSIDILAPPRATLGPYGAHRTPLEPVPRAKANGPFQRARACCGPPQSARPASREIGARGPAGRRGARRHILRPPRTVRAPPQPRAPLRTSAPSRRALSQSPNTLRSGSCRRPGARGASTRSRRTAFCGSGASNCHKQVPCKNLSDFALSVSCLDPRRRPIACGRVH